MTERTRIGRGGREESRSRDSGRGGRSDSGRSGSRFVYRERSAEDTKKRAESGGSLYDVYVKDSIKTWKPADGDNTIRILPPTWDDPKHYGVDIWVHYGVGPDRQTYLCLHKMKGEPCPLCEEHQKAVRDGDEEYARELRPTRRVLVYLIDRDHEKEGVQAYAMPQSMDTNILQVSVDKRSGEVLSIDHPEAGYDISFEKKGTKDRTKYEGIQVARRESDLGREEWLDFAVDNPLPDQLIYYEYDHILAAFGGSTKQRDSRPGSRDKDDEPPTRSSRHREPERQAPKEPELTWESVHAMTGAELEDLVAEEKLDINVNEPESDDELADWICEDLKLKKAESRRESSRDSGGSSTRERLMRMRG